MLSADNFPFGSRPSADRLAQLFDLRSESVDLFLINLFETLLIGVVGLLRDFEQVFLIGACMELYYSINQSPLLLKKQLPVLTSHRSVFRLVYLSSCVLWQSFFIGRDRCRL